MIRNLQIPSNIKRIYFMAICGTGMGSLAGLLQERGYEISGSDNNIYPPMSEELTKRKIQIHSPYSPENLKNGHPDLVIVGNAISKTNPEAEYLLQSNIPYISMPEALHHFFLKEKKVIVVSGTHGKTTTTALTAFLLEKSGHDPSFLIGGVTKNLSSQFKISEGPLFVIEGDEYDTAFFDKGPKFLHYNPSHVIMTSLEFDHADIYRDLNHVRSSFEKLVDIIPQDGSLHFSDEYPVLEDVCQKFNGFKRKYGTHSQAWAVKNYLATENGSSFDIYKDEKQIANISWKLTGLYNALNAAASLSALDHIGLSIQKLIPHFSTFEGVKRRQDKLFESQQAIVIDDFAHHPTAVAQTISAIHDKYPNRKLIAVFEPRSNSSIRSVFQTQYENCFTQADEVFIAPIANPGKVTDGSLLDIPKIISRLSQSNKLAATFKNNDDLLTQLVERAQGMTQPVVFLTMSNGGFEGIPKRLAEKLRVIFKH